MFADASAITAILTDEDDARLLLARMETYSRRITSPLAVWEATLGVARKLKLELVESEMAVEAFLQAFGVEVVAVPADARRDALAAHVRFGKGRHPARLNFGECFAYACARNARAPMLYKGDDFLQTDIEAA